LSQMLLIALFLSVFYGKIVLTPFGPRESACVLQVEHDSQVTPLPNGKLEIRTGKRLYYHSPNPMCGNDIQQIKEKYAAKRNFEKDSASIKSGLKDGWLDYAGWYPPTGESNLNSFTSTYTVPGIPPSNDGQTLFYFIGMQDNDDPNAVNIVQPVLTWGNGKPQWYAQSWACCPSNITVSSPPVFGLSPGSTLNGVIKRVSASTWRIESIVTSTGQKTTLDAQVGDYIYNWADVTLETYGVHQCSDYAPGKAYFTKLNLQDQQGQSLNPSWTFTSPTECEGSISQLTSTSMVIQHSSTEKPE